MVRRHNGLFTYSIVVADNDHLRSAEAVVSAFATASTLPIRYCVEPRQNISLARHGPSRTLTVTLSHSSTTTSFRPTTLASDVVQRLRAYEVHGVLGPVQPHFDEEPPAGSFKAVLRPPELPDGVGDRLEEGPDGQRAAEKRIFAPDPQPFNPVCR